MTVVSEATQVADKETVFSILKQIGIKKPEKLLSSANGRAILQNLVYLAQEKFEIELGFKFRWYVQ